MTEISGHGGTHILAAAQAYGVQTLFTLSGAHIFPLYDAAIGGAEGYQAAGGENANAMRSGPMRLVDVRHEQTAVFAAEGTAKLTRTPGFAAVTAGPGVTNAISAIASASFNGVPMVVVGGRSPDFRWGAGALQEIDHVPLVEPLVKQASTLHDPQTIGAQAADAFAVATTAHRGPVFFDVPMDQFYVPVTAEAPTRRDVPPVEPDPDAVAAVAELLAKAERPVLILGSDVWTDFAETEAAALAHEAGIPVLPNGMGRGIIPAGDPLLVSRARKDALGGADLVIVVGTPLDFRIGYGVFGDAADPTPVVHIADSPERVSSVPTVVAGIGASIAASLAELLTAWTQRVDRADRYAQWAADLALAATAATERDVALLTSNDVPIHPGRIYGELMPRLDDSAVVIGDGGDFVSFAGRFVEPARPGCWMDPGPYGCLGTGMGYAMAARIARPDDQVVLLLGDGAAGFSLMDVDTLVRHELPVVIIVGNNSAWGLEKHPMRLLHQYDVAADLQPATRYDDVVRALGGAGETVTDPAGIGPALDRAFASGVPYLVNVITDPEKPYPRSTTGL